MSASEHGQHYGRSSSPEDNDGSIPSPEIMKSNSHETHLSDSDRNLDEIAAPPPIYDTSEKSVQQERYLDNQRPENDDSHISLPHDLRQKKNEPAAKWSFSKVCRTMRVMSHLVLFSFLGTLLRVTIESLTFYPGTPVNTSVLWANVAGSLVMGFLSEDQRLFRLEETSDSSVTLEGQHDNQRAAHKAHKKTIPLYIGLTTGFCGSLTSFSTFIRDVFLALANDLPVPVGSYSATSLYASGPNGTSTPNGGFSFMALVAVLFVEVGLCLAGLMLGAHIAIGVSTLTPRIGQPWLQKIFDPVVTVLAWLSWIAIICLAVLLPEYSTGSGLWSAEVWRGPVLFSLVFAPLGCLGRFYISMKLDGRLVPFPLGTFVVNVAGTMVLGLAYSLQHASISASSLGGGSIIGCQVLQGIMDGFCGCLTTVSTWVLELSDLRRRHAYFYGGLSVAVALCALVMEIGSLKWTQGLVTPICFTS